MVPVAEKLKRLLPHFSQHVSAESLIDVAERFMTSSMFLTQHVAESGFQSFFDRVERFGRAEFSDATLADWAVMDSLAYRLPVSETSVRRLCLMLCTYGLCWRPFRARESRVLGCLEPQRGEATNRSTPQCSDGSGCRGAALIHRHRGRGYL